MGPEALAQVLRPLTELVPPERRADLIAGLAEGDDAAILRIDAERALVYTVDFFTPIVDDPYDYGAVAAANALSDVYACGGEPLMALNVAAFPADLPTEIIARIIKGGADKAAEASCVVAGGHTIHSKEPVYGLAVIGLAHPDRLFLKSGAKPGDAIVLTKPLGTGMLATRAKAGKADPAHMARALDSMKTLNRDAARALARYGTRACTDVTGFSLVGHALELAEKSRVGMEFSAAALPLLDGALDAAKDGFIPGGAKRNRSFYKDRARFADGIPEALIALCFGPETSGGLLAAVPAGAEACVAELRALGLDAAVVGRCVQAGATPSLSFG